jgi:hypothetical protein
METIPRGAMRGASDALIKSGLAKSIFPTETHRATPARTLGHPAIPAEGEHLHVTVADLCENMIPPSATARFGQMISDAV